MDKELLARYKRQNPVKYKQKFVDPIVPGKMEVPKSAGAPRPNVEDLEGEGDANEGDQGVPAEHQGDSEEV